MKFKQILSIVLISGATSLASIWGYNRWIGNPPPTFSQSDGKTPVNYANFVDRSGNIAAPVDFTQAAEAASPAVVHIKTKIPAQQVDNRLPRRGNSIFDEFFGDGFGEMFGGRQRMIIPEQRASGSGVLISEDGYIVTNNHVISDGKGGLAAEINVTLANKQSYKAKVIGNDPSTDLAVLKIDGKNLPFLLYGNSDNVKIGQWVLAIGYPLNLEATVTAGIVSAKARSLSINSRQSQTPVESFLQTDAAVNQGNSGGALINTNGELIGINSAIASPTGYYSGYSYAIPVNLVKKTVNDLIKFGSVQRAYLGIQYPNESLSEEERIKRGIKIGEGVYVVDVAKDGAAAAAGIKAGDIITKINGEKISTGAEMVGMVATYAIGDKVTIEYKRNDKLYTTTLTLKGSPGTYTAQVDAILDKLGAEFKTIEKSTASKLGIRGGVEVKNIGDGLIGDQTRMKNGFVITKVGNTNITSVDEFKKAISQAGNSTTLEGVYPGYDGVYIYSLNDINK